MFQNLVDTLSEEAKRLNKMREICEENLCELKELEVVFSAVCIKERKSNDELQEARKELIKGLEDSSSGGGSCKIGIKRMGQLDEKPFAKVCKERFSGEEVELQFSIVCEEWQDKLKDPSWHPIKIVNIGDNLKEVVDEEDEKIKSLREEWGGEAMNAVKTALEELNEYNASGRYSIPELWNYEQGRQATLKEGIAYMANLLSNANAHESIFNEFVLLES